jgi:uncharacterized membrane protein
MSLMPPLFQTGATVMSAHRHAGKSLSDHTELGLERIVFFSDAVMAIAITLLVIDLKLPDIPSSLAAAELSTRLTELTPRVMSFIISFAVVGVYWSSHHRYFNYIKRYDGRLIALNLVFLLFVALMPFFASLLGQYGYLPIALIAYALAVAATGLAIGLVWRYASYQHRLVDHDLDAGFIRVRNLVALVVPLIFLASAPLALLSPWMTLAAWWISPLVSILVLRMLERRIEKNP